MQFCPWEVAILSRNLTYHNRLEKDIWRQYLWSKTSFVSSSSIALKETQISTRESCEGKKQKKMLRPWGRPWGSPYMSTSEQAHSNRLQLLRTLSPFTMMSGLYCESSGRPPSANDGISIVLATIHTSRNLHQHLVEVPSSCLRRWRSHWMAITPFTLSLTFFLSLPIF